jgi:hypothetical protein
MKNPAIPASATISPITPNNQVSANTANGKRVNVQSSQAPSAAHTHHGTLLSTALGNDCGGDSGFDTRRV